MWVTGPILHLSELESWADQCERMHRTLTGSARLECMEPNVQVLMSVAGPTGQVAMTVSVTADHVVQRHEIEFLADQSCLPGVIEGCRMALRRFPLRGASVIEAQMGL